MTRLRTASLLTTGALAVHELRYALAGGAGDAVAGHTYLPLAGLAAAVLVAAACAQLGHAMARAKRTGRGERVRLGFVPAWLLAALSLAAIFSVQEALEGLLAGGRSGGGAAVAGSAGWLAYPLCIAVGALVALGLTGARAAVSAAAAAGRLSSPARRIGAGRGAPLGSCRSRRPRPGVLAARGAGRAPPLAA